MIGCAPAFVRGICRFRLEFDPTNDRFLAPMFQNKGDGMPELTVGNATEEFEPEPALKTPGTRTQGQASGFFTLSPVPRVEYGLAGIHGRGSVHAFAVIQQGRPRPR